VSETEPAAGAAVGVAAEARPEPEVSGKAVIVVETPRSRMA
jgi:hypothetical protein